MQVMIGSGSNTAPTLTGAASGADPTATLSPMRTRSLGVVVVALSIVLAACGGDDDVAVPAVTSTTARVTTTSTAPPPTTAVPLAVSALTGLPGDPAALTRPIVAVKIDNVDGHSTPQMGINQADVVYEVQVEGQITRLLSLFQSTDAAPVGPVRSARGSEVGLLEELHEPLFTWHGANGILAPIVRAASVVPRSIDDIPELFFRDHGRKAPYNSFVQGIAQIRATAPAGSSGPDHPILTFARPGAAPSPYAVPMSHVAIVFPAPFGGRGARTPLVDYTWNGAQWLRNQKGHPHVDAAGEQVAVENVIVRFTEALDSGSVDSTGTRVPTAKVVGEGEAWVFSQGTVTVGRWIKPDNATPTRYVDQDGHDIGLTPGQTWISMPYGGGSSFR